MSPAMGASWQRSTPAWVRAPSCADTGTLKVASNNVDKASDFAIRMTNSFDYRNDNDSGAVLELRLRLFGWRERKLFWRPKDALFAPHRQAVVGLRDACGSTDYFSTCDVPRLLRTSVMQ